MVPILGYFWVLERTEKDLKRLAAVAALDTSLLAVYLLLFLERGAMVPASTVDSIALATGVALVSGSILGTALETRLAGSRVASGSRLRRLVGWDAMEEMPRRDVARKFLFANYHESMFALTGMFLGLLLHG